MLKLEVKYKKGNTETVYATSIVDESISRTSIWDMDENGWLSYSGILFYSDVAHCKVIENNIKEYL